MAQTSVSLPNINKLACGVVKSYLYYDDSITPLTIPTTAPFLDIGEIKESVDLEAGFTDLENVDVVVAEDYSTHAEGFWHKLINGNPTLPIEIMFTLMEDDDETFLFRGKLSRQGTLNTEYYLDVLSGTPNSWVRGIEFKLISSLKVLEDVSIEDLITECNLHMTQYSDVENGAYAISVGGLIASMIKLGYGTSYDSSLCVNHSTDIRFRSSGGTLINNWDVAGLTVQLSSVNTGFFSTSPAITIGWYNRFANAYDLLRYLCFGFGVIPKYQYGDEEGLIGESNNHRLIFNSRGNSASTVTMPNKFDESYFFSDTPRKAKTFRINEPGIDLASYWFLNGVLEQGDVPPFAEFDIDGKVDFIVNTPIAPLADNGLVIWDAVNEIFTTPAEECDYWRYSDASRQVVTVAVNSCHAKALVQYLFYRFQPGRIEWARVYNGLGAQISTIVSQRYNQTLMASSIHDGVGVPPRDFYATEVTKNLKTNKSKVVWVQS